MNFLPRQIALADVGRRSPKKRNLTLLVCFAVLSSFVSHAIESETSEIERTAALEEVFVTAQKKVENLQDVALSIGTFDEESLRETLAGGADVLALANRIPSLYLESSNGRLAPRVYIRGLGNVDFDLNASQPVSFVLDEVVLENPAAKSFPLFDIQRVEVLRGPQGTLFGRNTTAGIVKFDSNLPTAGQSSEYVASIGNFGHRRFDLALNNPVRIENADVRFAFMYNSMGNWVDNVAPGFEAEDALGSFEDFGAKLLISFSPSERLKVLLNIHGRSLVNGTPTLFRANVIRPGTNELIPGFKRSEVSMDAASDYFQHADAVGTFAKAEYQLENMNVIWILGVHSVLDQLSRGDIDGGYGSIFGGVLPSGPPPGIPFDAQTADRLSSHLQITNEIRLEGMTVEREWRVGFYQFAEQLEIETFNYDTVFERGLVNGYVLQEQDTTAWALFGTTTLYSTDELDVSGGIRFSADAKDFTAQRTISPLSGFGVGGIGPLSVSPSKSVVTWDVNALYEVNDRTNLFGRIARGHRTPSIQGRLLFQDEISVSDTETSLSYEVGFKSLLLDRRLRLNGSFFTYDVFDFQVTKIGGAANVSELVNLENLSGMGIELKSDLYLNEAWLLNVGWSMNQSEIEDPNLTIKGCGSANLLNGCTVLDEPAANDEYYIHGNSLYQSPKQMVQLNLRYSRPLARGYLNVSTDWAYRSDLRFTLYRSLEYSSDATLEGGLRVGYETANGRNRLTCFVRNITDETFLVGSIDFNNLTGMVNNPRLVGFEYRLLR